MLWILLGQYQSGRILPMQFQPLLARSSIYNTLVRLLKLIKGITVVDCIPPYNIRIRTKYHPESIRDIIEEYRKKIDPYELIIKNDYLEYEKFDRYIPKQLLKQKFVNDKIDLEFSL